MNTPLSSAIDMWKLSLGEVSDFYKFHKASSWDLNLGHLSLEPTLNPHPVM